MGLYEVAPTGKQSVVVLNSTDSDTHFCHLSKNSQTVRSFGTTFPPLYNVVFLRKSEMVASKEQQSSVTLLVCYPLYIYLPLNSGHVSQITLLNVGFMFSNCRHFVT